MPRNSRILWNLEVHHRITQQHKLNNSKLQSYLMLQKEVQIPYGVHMKYAYECSTQKGNALL